MPLLSTRIDLHAIAVNTQHVKKSCRGAQLMAVVKADAYNHGAVECARVMEDNGADRFGVATFSEARQLRQAGITKPILAWIWWPGTITAQAIADNVDIAIISPDHIAPAVHAARAAGRTATVHVMVDTGMNRSGIDEEDWGQVFSLLANTPELKVTGMFSHLAFGDEPDNDANNKQADLFRQAIGAAKQAGLNPTVNHFANSAACMSRPDLAFDMVRPGLSLYGLGAIPNWDQELIPAMTWVSHVTTVKRMRAGEGVSYGLTWRAKKDTTTAVIAVGYADGLSRNLQEKIGIAIGGRRYPQIGRLCMDQIIVDLGDNPHGIVPGDEAYIFGPGKHGELSADDIAAAQGTINYEVICAPRGRTIRTFVR